jgi:hypothetical protein
MNTPQQMADMIFNEFHSYAKLIGYSIESKKMLEAIALDMAITSVNLTLDSHNTKDEIMFWSKTRNLLKGKLLNGKLWKEEE